MAHATSAAHPLVSVESVLAQTYPHFEYILMDNCSTGGSAETAEIYTHRDPRICLIRCSEFLCQLANYDRALTRISDESEYCKIVQADDWISPKCLQLMARSPTKCDCYMERP
jgi:glycosyltransferase involved in cell wall biosynthesis